MPFQATAAENLEKGDYVGKWVSLWAATKGETQFIYINQDMSSRLERHFSKDDKQILYSKPGDLDSIEDILIFRYLENNNLVYKLALSGWKSGSVHQMYGTLFLYKDGKQFNGLPVSFGKAMN